jgi:hypothetical protein
MAYETEIPRRQLNDNYWYQLATLYGEPSRTDEELQGKNRVVWNRCVAAQIKEEFKVRLMAAGKYAANELEPFSHEELLRVEAAFAERSQSDEFRGSH